MIDMITFVVVVVVVVLHIEFRRFPAIDAVVMSAGVCVFITTLACIALSVTAVNRHEPHEHVCVHDDAEFAATLHGHGLDTAVPQEYTVPDGHRFREQAAGEYQPLRVVVSSLDLDDTSLSCQSIGGTASNFNGGRVECTSSDQIFTAAKKEILLNQLLPAAIKMHTDRLQVVPVSGPLKLSPTSVCQHFNIPASHTSTGVDEADFVLYVGAGLTPDSVAAWAGACAYDQFGRPIAGKMNINPSSISNASKRFLESSKRTVAHELAHALGFSSSSILAFSNLTSTASVRGKPSAKVITAPSVVAAARRYFNCSTLTYVELEDEGGSGTAGSHWERRNHIEDLMAGVSYRGYYSNMTLALFHDSGLYRANFSVVDDDARQQFARNAGCSFLSTPCLANGISNFPQLFCNDTTGEPACTWDRGAVGRCSAEYAATAAPSYQQYFAHSNISGATPCMDGCPFVEEYSNMRCTEVANSGSNDGYYGVSFGDDSRCLEVDGFMRDNVQAQSVPKAQCMRVRCVAGVRLQFAVASVSSATWFDCPFDGSEGPASSVAGFSGSVKCPLASFFCGDRSLLVPEPTTSTTSTRATTTTTFAPTSTTLLLSTTAAPTSTNTPTTLSTTTMVPAASNKTARFTIAANSSAADIMTALSRMLVGSEARVWAYRLVANASGDSSSVLEMDFDSVAQRDAAIHVALTNRTGALASVLSAVSVAMDALPPATTTTPPANSSAAASSEPCEYCPSSKSVGILVGCCVTVVITVIVICLYKRNAKAKLKKSRERYSEREIEKLRQSALNKQQIASVTPRYASPGVPTSPRHATTSSPRLVVPTYAPAVVHVAPYATTRRVSEVEMFDL